MDVQRASLLKHVNLVRKKFKEQHFPIVDFVDEDLINRAYEYYRKNGKSNLPEVKVT